MRFHEILIEALSDKLKLLHNLWKKLANEYKNLDANLDEDIWNELVKTDPTKNKQYLQWIITKGIKSWKSEGSRVFLEDLPKIQEDLIKYHTLKTKNKLKPEHKDINKIPSDLILYQILKEYDDTDSNRDKDKNIEKAFYENNEAELVVNNNKWKIVKPKTEKASCYFGINTRWCTASKNNNWFEKYYEEGDLYIILHKPTNERWQFHLASASFMDEEDREEDFDYFNRKCPEIFGEYITFTEEEQIEAVQSHSSAIKFINNPSEEIQLIAVQDGDSFAYVFIDNPTENVKLSTVQENPDMLEYIHDPSEEVQLTAIRHDPYTIRYIENPSETIQIAALKINDAVIRWIDNPTEKVQILAIRADEFNVQYIKNPTERVSRLIQELQGKPNT